jgi:hypothetical protein
MGHLEMGQPLISALAFGGGAFIGHLPLAHPPLRDTSVVAEKHSRQVPHLLLPSTDLRPFFFIILSS